VPLKPAFGVYVQLEALHATVPLVAAGEGVVIVSKSPSTSLSFASTLIGFAPLSWATVAASSTATGGSFTAVTVIETIAATLLAIESFALYLKLSDPL